MVGSWVTLPCQNSTNLLFCTGKYCNTATSNLLCARGRIKTSQKKSAATTTLSVLAPTSPRAPPMYTESWVVGVVRVKPPQSTGSPQGERAARWPRAGMLVRRPPNFPRSGSVRVPWSGRLWAKGGNLTCPAVIVAAAKRDLARTSPNGPLPQTERPERARRERLNAAIARVIGGGPPFCASPPGRPVGMSPPTRRSPVGRADRRARGRTADKPAIVGEAMGAEGGAEAAQSSAPRPAPALRVAPPPVRLPAGGIILSASSVAESIGRRRAATRGATHQDFQPGKVDGNSDSDMPPLVPDSSPEGSDSDSDEPGLVADSSTDASDDDRFCGRWPGEDDSDDEWPGADLNGAPWGRPAQGKVVARGPVGRAKGVGAEGSGGARSPAAADEDTDEDMPEAVSDSDSEGEDKPPPGATAVSTPGRPLLDLTSLPTQSSKTAERWISLCVGPPGAIDSFVVRCFMDTDFKVIRAAIEEHTGVRAHIAHCGKSLEDGRTPRDYNLFDRDHLQIYGGPRGGARPKKQVTYFEDPSSG